MGDSWDLQEELQSILDLENYQIASEHDPSSEDIDSILEGAIEAVAQNPDNIAHEEILDVYRSVLKHSEHVENATMGKLLDSITSALLAEVDATVQDEQEETQVLLRHRRNIEIYVFLLSWFSGAVDSLKSASGENQATPVPKGRRGRGGKSKAGTSRAKKGGANWVWEDHITSTLDILPRIMKSLHRVALKMWTTGERETFIQCATRPAYRVMENEGYMKNDNIKKAILKVICFAVKYQGHVLHAQVSILQLLQYKEHLSEPMAELIACLINDMDHTQLGDEILQDISSKQFASSDSRGVRSFARFLVHLTVIVPKAVDRQLSLLLSQLDSESYTMRISLVEVLGHLIKYRAANETGEQTEQKANNKVIRGLYQLLGDRMLDNSSYVRSKVLQVFMRLCDEVKAKFPKQRMAMTQVAEGALMDKVSTVRKNAIALLVKLVKTHPYVTRGGELERWAFQQDYDEVVKELKPMERFGAAVDRQDEDESQSQPGDEMDVDDGEETEKEDEGGEEDEDEEGENEETQMQVDSSDEEAAEAARVKKEKKHKLKRKKLARRSTLNVRDLETEQANLASLDQEKITGLTLKKKYLSEALKFMDILEEAMPKIVKLLGSTHKPEVLEAMEFFKTADEYKIAESEVGIKTMLHLIWAKDNTSTSEDGNELKGIRSRLLECYRTMYFEPIANLDPKSQVNRIAKNMVERTYDTTLAELTSLEEMMRIMMEENQVHDDVINKLWQIYASERNLPWAQRRGAIIILGMLALARRSILTDRVRTMLKIGFGRFGKEDLTLARYTCVALQRLNGSVKKVKGSLEDKTLRIDMEDPIFKHLQEVIEAPCRSKEWFGLAEQAVNTIYALGDHPDHLTSEVIKKLTVRAMTPKESTPALPSSTQDGEAEPSQADPDAMEEAGDGGSPSKSQSQSQSSRTPQPASQDAGDPFELSQLLFVIGHVAMKQVVYMESVEKEWKRQKDEQSSAEKKNAAKAKNKKDKDGEDLDQVVGNAEDEIGDDIKAAKEMELLYGPNSLLAVYGPLLVHICGSPHIYKDKTLRAAATLSFSKFLTISPQYCQDNYRLLFKILETSKDANIRSNIVIALGDVAVSFSTIVDENSDELYRGLSDEDEHVKKNTLMVLTHLILNGMIKIKGQLGEMAKCLGDEDPRIADLAKLFFSEFANKENAIYNNLPDVISHLSTGPHSVDEETFQETLRYIFGFIEKEKQAENIVDKLCQRFKAAEEPRQWRDIAFCMSLLPFKSERSVRKLIEGLPSYKDKLHEPTVYERFQEILTKARQNKSPNKPDTELNEFEQILNDNKDQGEEDQALQRRVEGKKAAAKRRAGKKGGRRKAATPPPEEEEEAEEEAEE